MSTHSSAPQVHSGFALSRQALIGLAAAAVIVLLVMALLQVSTGAGSAFGIIALIVAVVAWGRRGRGYLARHAKLRA